MRRGDVWWADLPPPDHRRPVVLLSRNRAYAIRDLVTVAPVTTRVRGILAEVLLGPGDGLPQPCVANLDNLLTIPKTDLLQPITHLSRLKMREVEAAIHYALALSW